jgi:hypothetical protein
MVGTIAAAICAAFVLYGGWVVVRELMHGARRHSKEPAPEEAALPKPVEVGRPE